MNVTLIDDKGNLVGNLNIDEAKRMAKSTGNDLILVNPQNNIYKMADRGKLKFDQKQKEKKQKAQQKMQKVKEIQIGPHIERHDLDVKINHIKEFLSKGLKTKVIVKFKNRQLAFKEIGIDKMTIVINEIINNSLGSIDSSPKFEGRDLIVLIFPNKNTINVAKTTQ